MATNYCPQCGRAVDAEDRFCPTCGAALVADDSGQNRPAGAPSKMPVAIAALAAIGLLLIVAGFFFNREGAPQTAVEPPALPETARPESEIPFPDVSRIDVAEAADRQLNGATIFVDVRDAADYAEAHIPDARSLPLGDTTLDPAYRQLPQDAEIITYCT